MRRVDAAEHELLRVTGCALELSEPFGVVRSMLQPHSATDMSLLRRATALLHRAMHWPVWGSRCPHAVAFTVLHLAAAGARDGSDLGSEAMRREPI